MIPFAKVKPSQKIGLQTPGELGLLLPTYFAFNCGFPSLQQNWHTPQGFQKTNDHLQNKKSLKRRTNERGAANEFVPCFLLASRKGDFALRLSTCSLAEFLVV